MCCSQMENERLLARFRENFVAELAHELEQRKRDLISGFYQFYASIKDDVQYIIDHTVTLTWTNISFDVIDVNKYLSRIF